MPIKPIPSAKNVELRRRAEAQLQKRSPSRLLIAQDTKSSLNFRRMFHELQVHQVELEMQNAELKEARDRQEATLENYTDLYEFAPVGYFTLTADGTIRQVNLAGAQLVGITRNRLVGQSFGPLVSIESRRAFASFLKQVFATGIKQSRESTLMAAGRAPRSVTIEAERMLNRQECRAVVVDITERKQAEATQHRLAVLSASNQKLEKEVIQRRAVEESLKESEQRQGRLLAQAHQLQEQLRQLSRQVLRAQEEERLRISHELHDVIAQTLTGINIRLANLRRDASLRPKDLNQNIESTQRMVAKSVEIVHQFARELRPAVLDDLGLIPALHSYMKEFTALTGVCASLTTFATVDQFDSARRAVLFRVVQEALTNVAKHAHASRVNVILQKQPEYICMKIIDDGRSFDVSSVIDNGGLRGLGLLGMRERLEMVGGCFKIESAPGQGTTITTHIPASNGNRKRGTR